MLLRLVFSLNRRWHAMRDEARGIYCTRQRSWYALEGD